VTQASPFLAYLDRAIANCGGSVTLNVVGGVVTVVVVEVVKWLHTGLNRRRFRTVMGLNVRRTTLTIGKLVSDGASIFRLEGPDDYRFRSSEIGSFAEIRGLSYVARSIGQNSSIETQVTSAQEVAEAFDLDFIAIGAMTNAKSIDMFRNPANTLAEYSLKDHAFVRKKDKSVLWRNRNGYDHGIIMKIRPAQFPSRTWITCSGFGEWGTSGAAYYLANHWRDLHNQLGGADKPFVAVIEVQEGKDQSALLQLFECDARS
jgi:hypothetical protein